jgi:hypothetical protein
MTRAEIVAELRSSHLHMYDGSRDGHGMKVFKLCTAAADTIEAQALELEELQDGRRVILPQTKEHAQNLYTVAVACLKGHGVDVEK